MGTQLPLRKGTEPPNFRSLSVVAKWLHGSRCHLVGTRELGLSPSEIVLDGDPASLPKRGRSPSPIFFHVYCSQTPGWIKMALDMEVDLGPGHIVLDGDDPVPLPKRGQSRLPNFRPISIVAKRLHASTCHLGRGSAPFWGTGTGSPSNTVAWAEAYLRAK